MSEVKIYEARKPLREVSGLYNPDFTEPVVLKYDYLAEKNRADELQAFKDKYEADCKRIEYFTDLHDKLTEANADVSKSLKIIIDKNIKIKVLEAKLEKAIEQRNTQIRVSANWVSKGLKEISMGTGSESIKENSVKEVTEKYNTDLAAITELTVKERE